MWALTDIAGTWHTQNTIAFFLSPHDCTLEPATAPPLSTREKTADYRENTSLQTATDLWDSSLWSTQRPTAALSHLWLFERAQLRRSKIFPKNWKLVVSAPSPGTDPQIFDEIRIDLNVSLLNDFIEYFYLQTLILEKKKAISEVEVLKPKQ